MKNRVGCKIYSNKDERARIDAILSSQSKESPIEIGFYNKDGQYGLDDEFIEILNSRFNDFSRKIVHLSMRNVLFGYGKNQKEWLELLAKETDLAIKIGALYALIHDTKWPPSLSKEDDFLAEMAKNAKAAKDNVALPLYMENTFRGVEFYKKFFDIVGNEINFCFDVGHTRVWSVDDYEAWFGFLQELKKGGVKTHFHIHTNNMVFDEHLSFFEKDDPETVSFVKSLINEFEESFFILEIKQDFRESIELFEPL